MGYLPPRGPHAAIDNSAERRTAGWDYIREYKATRRRFGPEV